MKTNIWRWVAAFSFGMAITASLQAVSTIQFAAASFTVAESAGTAPLTVQRTGDVHRPE